MLNIIREEWRARKRPFLFTSALLLGINTVAFLLLIFNMSSVLTMIWLVFGGIFTFITGLFYVLCFGSVNISRILFKDTSYLLLSIPYNGYIITGGKLIAGLAEFIAIGIQCVFYGIIYIVFMSCAPLNEFLHAFWPNTGFVLRFLFIDNSAFISLCFVLLVFGFVMVGALVSAAGILIGSFWKHRKFAGLFTVIVLILMISIPFKTADLVYDSLPSVKEWNQTAAQIGTDPFSESLSIQELGFIMEDTLLTETTNTSNEKIVSMRGLAQEIPFTTIFHIPVIHSSMELSDGGVIGTIPFPVNWFYIIVLMIFTSVYFVGSAWLLERRVEV